MNYKSFGEIYLSQFLLEKKKNLAAKEESTKRLIQKRDAALKRFKETRQDEYRQEVEFYNNILNRSKKIAA